MILYDDFYIFAHHNDAVMVFDSFSKKQECVNTNRGLFNILNIIY